MFVFVLFSGYVSTILPTILDFMKDLFSFSRLQQIFLNLAEDLNSQPQI